MGNTLKTPIGESVQERKFQINKTLLWLLVFSIAYLLRDIAKLPMPDILFTGVCGLAFFLLPTGSAMGVYMFTSALTVPDFEIRLVYLAVLILKFWMQNKKFKASMLMVIISMAFLELLNMMLFSKRAVFGVIYDVVMRLSYFVLPAFWFSEDYSKEDYKRALLCYVGGVILGGAVMLWISVEAVGWKVLLQGAEVRLGLNTTNGYVTQSAMRTSYNANQLGCMFTIVVATALAMMDRKMMSKFWGILLIVFSAFLIVLTKSRTAILLLFGIVIVYCLILIFRRKKLLTGVLFLAAIAALTYGIMTLFPETVEDLMARFQDETNRTGGRDVLFAHYMTAWTENAWVFLFGYGIGSYYQVVNISNVPHNILTDILISWGLVGIVLVVVMLVCLWRHTAKCVGKKERLLVYFPAIVALVAEFSGQYLSTSYPHMRLCFLIMAAKALVESTQTNLEHMGG